MYRALGYAFMGCVLLVAGAAGIYYVVTLLVGLHIGYRVGAGKWLEG